MTQILRSPGVVVVMVALFSCSTIETTDRTTIELELDATYAEGLGYLSTVRELSDGRVMFADPLGQAVVVWHPDAGVADTLGRVGSGPTEYRQPDAVFPLPADSTLLVDLGNARLTAIGPDGVFGEAFPIFSSRPDAFPMNLMPRFTDAMGRIYFYQSANRRGSMADSAYIGRFDRGDDIIDTVGVLRIPIPEFERVGDNMTMTSGPLMPRDDWAVGPDGYVAVVRAADYSVEWIAGNGSFLRGSPTGYQPVRIGISEQERWADEAQANMMHITSVMSREGGVSNMEMRRGGGTRPEVAAIRWPEELPPFHADRAEVSFEGDLWVERHVPAGAVPVIDVFGRDGNKAAEVTLPPGSRVVGFGEDAVYLVRADEYDLLWLSRYRIGY